MLSNFSKTLLVSLLSINVWAGSASSPPLSPEGDIEPRAKKIKVISTSTATATDVTDSNYIQDLIPKEVLIHNVLAFIPPQDLKNMRFFSKNFNTIIENYLEAEVKRVFFSMEDIRSLGMSFSVEAYKLKKIEKQKNKRQQNDSGDFKNISIAFFSKRFHASAFMRGVDLQDIDNICKESVFVEEMLKKIYTAWGNNRYDKKITLDYPVQNEVVFKNENYITQNFLQEHKDKSIKFLTIPLQVNMNEIEDSFRYLEQANAEGSSFLSLLKIHAQPRNIFNPQPDHRFVKNIKALFENQKIVKTFLKKIDLSHNFIGDDNTIELVDYISTLKDIPLNTVDLQFTKISKDTKKTIEKMLENKQSSLSVKL
jgi:hypothetical protein